MEKSKKKAMIMFGAVNVIDNTYPIPVEQAEAGDLIMSKAPPGRGYTGHTRIIYSKEKDPALKDTWKITWYEGSLPAIIPRKKTKPFLEIENVFDSKPRRWNFAQFNK